MDWPELPRNSSLPSVVLERLDSMRGSDVRWRAGRAFSLTYDAGDVAHDLSKSAYAAFSSENALNMDAFPSLRNLQRDVIGVCAGLLGCGADGGFGVFTSGGTESILTAVHGARGWGRAKGISRPNMVLPATAHAAFSKAASYFDVEARRVRVGSDYRADVSAMAEVIDDETVLVVGSAPAYPQGVIDPIDELGDLALRRRVLFHVDACMGFTLPFLHHLGYVDQPWNFEVDGVTSMSCDLHKYGYAAKGASVLLFATKELRRHAGFVTDDWLGGLYGSPALLGTRSGGGVAGAWAMFQHLGWNGYLELAERAITALRAIQVGIKDIPGLEVRGEPVATLLAFGAPDQTNKTNQTDRTDRVTAPKVSAFAVGDALWKRGWYVDRQTPPDSLHCTVNAVHGAYVDEFLATLTECAAEVSQSGSEGDRTRAYGTLE